MSEENEESESVGVFSDCASGNPTGTSSSTGPKKRAKMCAKAAIRPEFSTRSYKGQQQKCSFHSSCSSRTSGTGQDPSDMSLSVSSIRRSRSQHCMQAATEAKASSVSDGPLVVQCDGKLLPVIAGGPEKNDRITVVVTDLTCEKLLAIPKVVHGTGEQVTKAAAETLDSWSLTNDIADMSLDTTAANTGYLNGACVLLEQKSGRQLLWLACRHHIPEVLCGDVFRKVFGPTSGPNVTLFRRFHEYWPK